MLEVAIMQKQSVPVYEVEFIPAERRLSDRRRVSFDTRDLLAEDRRQCNRRQGCQPPVISLHRSEILPMREDQRTVTRASPAVSFPISLA